MLGIPGLSAAGISSGLAAIGAAVGGGMAAGTMIGIATSAVAVAVLGYLIYRTFLVQDLDSSYRLAWPPHGKREDADPGEEDVGEFPLAVMHVRGIFLMPTELGCQVWTEPGRC